MALTVSTRSLLRNVSFREDRNFLTPARFGEILTSLTDTLRTVEGRSALLHGVAAAVLEIFENTVELAAAVNICGTTHSIELSDRWEGVAHSALCVPVRVAGSEIGVFELHSAEPYAFDHAGVELISIMAHAVAGAIADQTQLTAALDSEQGLRDAALRRAPIEQAKGILMALNQITEDEAFSVLSVKSQHSNTKLSTIAAQFVETASTPQPVTGPLRSLNLRRSGHPDHMANYRVFDPKGDIVSTKTIDNATDAHSWFKDEKADNSELGWRLEVQHDADGEWALADDTDGTS